MSSHAIYARISSTLPTLYDIIMECENKSVSQLISQSFSSKVIEGEECTPRNKKVLTNTSRVIIFPSYIAVVVKQFESNFPRVNKMYTSIRDPLVAI